MPSGRRLRPALATLVAVVVLLAGCSDDGADAPPDREGGTAASEVTTQARVGKVRGRLSDARSDRLLQAVTAVVERWSDAAYTGSGKGAFASFTADARALAVKQTALGNARLKGDVGDASIAERRLVVDVLAPGGRPAGATARIRIAVELPGLGRTDEITGRLVLTPAKGGWKVFAFDVRRSEGGS